MHRCNDKKIRPDRSQCRIGLSQDNYIRSADSRIISKYQYLSSIITSYISSKPYSGHRRESYYYCIIRLLLLLTMSSSSKKMSNHHRLRNQKQLISSCRNIKSDTRFLFCRIQLKVCVIYCG